MDSKRIQKYIRSFKTKIWISYSAIPPTLNLKIFNVQQSPPPPPFSFSLLATCAEFSPLRHQPHPSSAIFLAKYVTRLAIRVANFLMATGWNDEPLGIFLYFFLFFFLFNLIRPLYHEIRLLVFPFSYLFYLIQIRAIFLKYLKICEFVIKVYINLTKLLSFPVVLKCYHSTMNILLISFYTFFNIFSRIMTNTHLSQDWKLDINLKASWSHGAIWRSLPQVTKETLWSFFWDTIPSS